MLQRDIDQAELRVDNTQPAEQISPDRLEDRSTHCSIVFTDGRMDHSTIKQNLRRICNIIEDT